MEYCSSKKEKKKKSHERKTNGIAKFETRTKTCWSLSEGERSLSKEVNAADSETWTDRDTSDADNFSLGATEILLVSSPGCGAPFECERRPNVRLGLRL